MIISLAVNATYANSQYGIFTASCSANNIGVYTRVVVPYGTTCMDTPPAVPLKINKATMIQLYAAFYLYWLTIHTIGIVKVDL